LPWGGVLRKAERTSDQPKLARIGGCQEREKEDLLTQKEKEKGQILQRTEARLTEWRRRGRTSGDPEKEVKTDGRRKMGLPEGPRQIAFAHNETKKKKTT